jgi:hypothetical protein
MKIIAQVKTALVSACLLGTVSGAADLDNVGPYVGIGLGSTAFNDNGMVDDINRELGSYTLELDDSSSGFKLYGGYKFNKIAAVEAAFTHYGDFHLKEYVFGTSGTFSPSSLSLSANLGYDFADGQFRPFALIGLSHVDLDGWVEDDTQAGIHIGFGVQYDPVQLNGFGFRLAYEADAVSVNTGISGATYIEENYGQSVGMLYISAHYRF